MIKGIGQEGIITYYKNNNNEYSTTKEISEAMNMNMGSVNRSLNRLLKFNRVEYKDTTNKHKKTRTYRRIIRVWRLKK